MSLRFLKIAALFVSLSMLAGTSVSTTGRNYKILPLKSEVSVGAYANLTYDYYGLSLPTSQYGRYSYPGFENYTVVSVNSTGFEVKKTASTVGNGTIFNEFFNVTYPSTTSPAGEPFPYYNNTILPTIFSIATVDFPNASANESISFGTYLFHGIRLPMERDTLYLTNYYNPPNPPNPPLTFNETFEFDTYSGILLNYTAHEIVNNSIVLGGGTGYMNYSESLAATNFGMTIAKSNPIEFIIAAITISVTVVAFAAIFWIRKKRKL